jgi:anti-sigma B factor antagonist
MSVTERSWFRPAGDGSLTVSSRPDGVTVVLLLHGELSFDTAAVLETEIDALLAAGTEAITLDLSGLEFLDSMGEQCLLHVARRSQYRRTEFRLVNARGQVERLLTLTGAKTLLPFAD